MIANNYATYCNNPNYYIWKFSCFRLFPSPTNNSIMLDTFDAVKCYTFTNFKYWWTRMNSRHIINMTTLWDAVFCCRLRSLHDFTLRWNFLSGMHKMKRQKETTPILTSEVSFSLKSTICCANSRVAITSLLIFELLLYTVVIMRPQFQTYHNLHPKVYAR